MELALAENFCMDFTLLYCAKTAAKNGAGVGRTALAAAIGAAGAVMLPLLPLEGPPYAAIKIAYGLIICAAGAKLTSFKAYFKYALAFFAFSAVLAGGLFALFYLTGAAYEEGKGFIYSTVPVGIPLFGALLLLLAAKRLAQTLLKGTKKAVVCRIYAGERCVCTEGFFDSGNRVYYRGECVHIVPEEVAQKLCDLSRIKDAVKIHTVAGSKTIKVFTADRLEILFDEGAKTYKKVKLGVSAAKIPRAALHPDILEG